MPPCYVPADSPDSDDAPMHPLAERLVAIGEAYAALEPASPLSLAERLALGNADDVEAALRRIYE